MPAPPLQVAGAAAAASGRDGRALVVTVRWLRCARAGERLDSVGRSGVALLLCRSKNARRVRVLMPVCGWLPGS